MSRLHDLLRQLEKDDAKLAADLRTEFDALADRRSFGLNFERHVPEAVELPGRPVRRGDKVRVLPPRGEKRTAEHDRLWRVTGITKVDGVRIGALADPNTGSEEQPLVTSEAPVDGLVVVSEFRDPIYPGLVSTGKVERGGDKPFHTVINAENFHALQALLFTHRGNVDCIYIDPPYNTGAKDWKYDNDYVEGDDVYRHSKWLAMMERRLLLAKELLVPDNSVLIVTIDQYEVARLSLLIEQIFPDRSVTAVHIQHNPRGRQGDNFSYVHETALFVTPAGRKVISERALNAEEIAAGTSPLRNWGGESERRHSANCFYPILIKDGALVGFGDAVDRDDSIHPSHNQPGPDGCTEVWPIDAAGVERKWRYSRDSVEGIANKLVIRRLERGTLNGEYEVYIAKGEAKYKTLWINPLFDASTHGSQVVKTLTGRDFPFPKSLYAVIESIRTVMRDRKDGVVVDFFAGSGTAAHAVMCLNEQDGGRRKAILVTNNEVSADEQKTLREKGLRPGDPEWEALGICDFITKPRIEAAITGKTPDGEPIKGDYKFTDEFPMADGFEENAEFFTLTYESAFQIKAGRAFSHVAPLLWMRAGSEGRRIEALPNGWDVADTYGVLADLDRTTEFLEALAANERASVAYIVTDEDRLFETIVAELPSHVEPVRLYDAYVRNFDIEAGRLAR